MDLIEEIYLLPLLIWQVWIYLRIVCFYFLNHTKTQNFIFSLSFHNILENHFLWLVNLKNAKITGPQHIYIPNSVKWTWNDFSFLCNFNSQYSTIYVRIIDVDYDYFMTQITIYYSHGWVVQLVIASYQYAKVYPQSGHMQESTSECTNKGNDKLMSVFLSPVFLCVCVCVPSSLFLKSINKKDKEIKIIIYLLSGIFLNICNIFSG